MHTINKKSIPLPTTAVCRRADSRGQGKNMQDQTQTTSSLPSSSERSSSSAPQTEETREGTSTQHLLFYDDLSLLGSSLCFFKHACASDSACSWFITLFEKDLWSSLLLSSFEGKDFLSCVTLQYK